MKKCIRCEITYIDKGRISCFYCDSSLVDVGLEDVFQAGSTIKEKFFKEDESKTHENMQHLVGSYFKVKSFSFLYAFDRNQMKMDENFKRFFVQPINFSHIIRLPWVIVDFIDSIFFRLIYTGYCKECDWKYAKLSLGQQHSQEECEYNKEYSTILKEILSGNIIKTEKDFSESANDKVAKRRRSAYHELCSSRRDFEVILDMVVIFMSMGSLAYFFIRATFPMFAVIYSF